MTEQVNSESDVTVSDVISPTKKVPYSRSASHIQWQFDAERKHLLDVHKNEQTNTKVIRRPISLPFQMTIWKPKAPKLQPIRTLSNRIINRSSSRRLSLTQKAVGFSDESIAYGEGYIGLTTVLAKLDAIEAKFLEEASRPKPAEY